MLYSIDNGDMNSNLYEILEKTKIGLIRFIRPGLASIPYS